MSAPLPHNAKANNFGGRDRPDDWRGDCGNCGWTSSPGWATAKRKARTPEQAERAAERHNRVETERESIVNRLLYTVLSDAKRAELNERLRRLR